MHVIMQKRELECLLNNKETDVVLTSETHLTDNYIRNFYHHCTVLQN